MLRRYSYFYRNINLSYRGITYYVITNIISYSMCSALDKSVSVFMTIIISNKITGHFKEEMQNNLKTYCDRGIRVFRIVHSLANITRYSALTYLPWHRIWIKHCNQHSMFKVESTRNNVLLIETRFGHDVILCSGILF